MNNEATIDLVAKHAGADAALLVAKGLLAEREYDIDNLLAEADANLANAKFDAALNTCSPDELEAAYATAADWRGQLESVAERVFDGLLHCYAGEDNTDPDEESVGLAKILAVVRPYLDSVYVSESIAAIGKD